MKTVYTVVPKFKLDPRATIVSSLNVGVVNAHDSAIINHAKEGLGGHTAEQAATTM